MSDEEIKETLGQYSQYFDRLMNKNDLRDWIKYLDDSHECRKFHEFDMEKLTIVMCELPNYFNTIEMIMMNMNFSIVECLKPTIEHQRKSDDLLGNIKE